MEIMLHFNGCSIVFLFSNRPVKFSNQLYAQHEAVEQGHSYIESIRDGIPFVYCGRKRVNQLSGSGAKDFLLFPGI